MIVTDQTGRTISIPQLPQRIISLVPSQTELLFDLGLEKEVVGITKFCVHPASWFKTKTRVGGTKQVKMEIVHQLKPDLIIVNKEENVKEQVEELGNHFPVWISDVNDLDDAYEMIEQIGIITNKEQEAKQIASGIKENFSRLPAPDSPLKTAYLIWREPYMIAGGDTFIHSMLETAGFDNVFKDQLRYPEVPVEKLSAYSLELLLLSSEPFPFKQKHAEELQQHLPGTKILLVDGEMFSWYGSRLLKAPAYFTALQTNLHRLMTND